MPNQFVLGFKELVGLLRRRRVAVGRPLENEHHNPESGDTLQLTSKGLLVWRRADNFTAFTNGERTWANGPHGIEDRLNCERFPWELPPVPPPVACFWKSPNCWQGRLFGPPVAIVIHTEGGSGEGTEATFMNPRTQVSAHYGVGLGGHIDQFVELGDTAWANGILEPGNRWGEVYDGPWNGWQENPNHWTVSVETEDLGNPFQVVTDDQYRAVRAVCRLAVEVYPTIRWLLRHADISPRTRPHCPGDRWVGSGRFADLARDLGLATLHP